MSLQQPTAMIAEDEPVLARGLARQLTRLWPALHICVVAHDGDAAINAALEHRPDVIFLDIKMPERSGLDAAEAIVDAWSAEHALPLIVFVTAFDRFAVDAFEQAAVDYVLKPVDAQRLKLTCERLQSRLAERSSGRQEAGSEPGFLAPLQVLRQVTPQEPPLRLIQAGIGSTLHMVPTAQVHYFEADDKHVRVVTADRSLLIRTPLRELMPRLDPTEFTQVHRGAIVRTELIEKVVREEAGKILLHLRGHTERLSVSRSYAHLFKPM